MLANELIRQGGIAHRDRTAVYFEDRRWTFGEVLDRAERLARALLAEGITPGTRIALLIDNGPWSLPMDFALMLGGFVRVPLNARLSVAEHARMVHGASVGVLLTESGLAARAREIAAAVEGLRVIGIDDSDIGFGTPLARIATQQPAGDPQVPVSPDHPVLALYTSGTTGTLKAAVHTQSSWSAIAGNILADLVSPGPGDVMLHAASLIHASGAFVLPFWTRGASSAVLPGFTPSSWLEGAVRYRATTANLVPTMLQMLLDHPATGGTDLPDLATLIYGASPMPRPVIGAALELWGPRFVQYYGQTEAPLAISVLNKQEHVGADAQRLLGSCGRAVVDAEVRLVDEEDREVAPGEPGELQVRAPFTMAGYLDAPELNRETMRADGWLATRDIARRDEQGYLYLVDRTSDMIVSGGYNVYPREVEDALLSHPAVREAAVVAAPDPRWVEAVTGFVVRTPGVTVDETALRDHVRARVAGYKVPKTIHFVEQIPKSAVGKVLRRALRDPLWVGRERNQQL